MNKKLHLKFLGRFFECPLYVELPDDKELADFIMKKLNEYLDEKFEVSFIEKEKVEKIVNKITNKK